MTTTTWGESGNTSLRQLRPLTSSACRTSASNWWQSKWRTPKLQTSLQNTSWLCRLLCDPESRPKNSGGLIIFRTFFWSVLGFFWMPASLLFCFSAFCFLCFSAFPASLLFCFSCFFASLFLCFSAVLLFCFSAFLAFLFSASLLFSAFCFSSVFAFHACLSLCLSTSICLCHHAFLLPCFFLLLCCSASFLYCLFAFYVSFLLFSPVLLALFRCGAFIKCIFCSGCFCMWWYLGILVLCIFSVVCGNCVLTSASRACLCHACRDNTTMVDGNATKLLHL